ncbi:MAG: hypothetical protein CMA97_04325, partial [Euryarchaeota archaeon]|nr:hypothetical protein [Euryarchaeota archaeon]
ESRAVWAGGTWVFERVMVEVKAKGEQFSQRKPSFTISTNTAPFGITAEHVEAVCWYQQLNERSQRKPLHLSTAEITKQRHLVSGIQSTVNLKGYLAKLEADSQSRLAEPVAYLIIAIFTASIYFRQGVASNYKLVAISLLFFAALSILQHFCLAVSIGGGLSVMFGVWGPIASGAIISLWSFQRAEG